MGAGSKVLFGLSGGLGYRRKGMLWVVGSFLPNGTGVPTFPNLQAQSGTNLLGVPGVQAVTWVSTGKWRIAFDKTYKQLIAFFATPELATPVAQALQMVTHDLAGSTVSGVASIDIINNPANTPTDIAANAGNIIYFGACFNESDTL